MFLSQQGEDALIYNRYINQRVKDGVMIELGGVNGITYSNTFLFEKYFGFKTILIEPQEKMFRDMVKNRPLSVCYRAAICNISGHVDFIGKDPCAGICDFMQTKDVENREKNNYKKYTVPTMRLQDIIEENKIEHVDLLSLDVEGGEKSVLDTIDFNKVDIYIVCIELDGKNEDKDDECRDILRKNGFTKHHRLCINEFWVNESYSKKDRLYSKHNFRDFKGINPRTKVSNYGKHPFTEPHILKEINEYIISQQSIP